MKRELVARPVQQVPETKIEIVEVPVITAEQIEALKTYAFMMNESAGGLIDSADRANKAAKEIITAITKPWTNAPSSARIQASKSPIKFPKKERDLSIPQEGISNPEQRILDAIAWFESIGIYEPRQEAVAFLAGYTYGGGAFNNPRGRLNTRGLVSYKGKCISLTDEGRNLATRPEIPLTKDALHERVLSVLPRPHQEILSALLGLYPNMVSKEELSDMVGRRGGAFNNPLGRLRSMGLIDYPERGMVLANSFLFME